MEYHITIDAKEKRDQEKELGVLCMVVKEGLGDKVIFGPSPAGGQRISCELNCRLRIPRKGQNRCKGPEGGTVCLRK